MVDGKESGGWTCVVRPKNGWFEINILELWRYRDLIMLFVHRDFVAVYKQTIFGPLWFLLQPLLTTLVFTVIFGSVAKMPTDGVPPILFYLSGVVFWNYFANCLNATSNTFVNNASIYGKVYFPRMVIPVSLVISNLLSFGLQFLMFLCFLMYFYLNGSAVLPGPQLLLLPLLVLQMALLALGTGIIVSSLTTKYRDLSHLVSFGVQLWMLATPVVYPSSQLPEQWRWIGIVNPVAPVIETFRHAFLGGSRADFLHFGISICITFAVLCIGIVLFSRIEKGFMDTV